MKEDQDIFPLASIYLVVFLVKRNIECNFRLWFLDMEAEKIKINMENTHRQGKEDQFKKGQDIFPWNDGLRHVTKIQKFVCLTFSQAAVLHTDDELSYVVGDQVTVLTANTGIVGQWRVRHSDGNVGMIRAAFVVILMMPYFH
jgi:hypothetical protein